MSVLFSIFVKSSIQMKGKTILCIFFLLSLPLSAGAERLHFNSITTDAGLSNNMVLAAAQDRQGFIWLGTAEGLNRFDGCSFRVFTHVPGDEGSLGSSWINCLLVASDGRILIGTERGLDAYDPDSESIVHITAANDSTGLLRTQRIRCLYEDGPILWAGTSEGLIRIDRSGSYMNFIKLAYPEAGVMANEVKAITRDISGNLWVGTFDGLYLFNPDNFTSRRFDVRRHMNYDQINNFVSSLLVMENTPDLLYVGTSNGLAVMNVTDFSCTYFRDEDSDLCNNDIKCLGIYDASHLLIGTANGLSLMDVRDGSFDNYTSSLTDRTSLPHETVWCTCEDMLSVIWMGTGNGLAKVNKKRKALDIFRLVTSRDDYVRNVVVNDLAIVPWGDFWVGTNSGIDVYDATFRKKGHYSVEKGGLMNNTIKRLIVDRSGVIWVGTNDGIAYFDSRRNRFIPVIPDIPGANIKYVYDIKEDSDGDIAVNINSGICIISPERRPDGTVGNITFSTAKINGLVSSDNTDVTYMDTDKNGGIWFGTINDGLFSYNKRSGEIRQYRFDADDPSSINSNRIYSIHIDGRGAVWAGTDMGLCRLDPGAGKFQRFASDPDMSTSIRTITSDSKDRLWICTMNKIMMYDYDYDSKVVCDVAEDLDCDELIYNSAFNTGDRYIYFGGNGGIIRLSATDIEKNLDKAPVLITSLEVGGETILPGKPYQGRILLKKSISQTERIVLSHSQNTLSIRFALMNYASVSNNRYYYTLHGLDKDWRPSSGAANFATYTGLKPGNYVFEVKACNPDDIYSDHSATLSIRIRPPWWASPWAFSVYAILALLAVAAALRFARVRWRLMTELKMEKLERSKVESLNKIKMNFFTNISHEFKTPLSLILGPIDSLMEKADDEKEKEQLSLMKHNGERMLRLITEILDLRRIDTEKITLEKKSGEIISFARKVFQSFSGNAEKRGITYEFIGEGEINCSFDSDKLEKILYNLLSNAFKFTPDKGSIRVSVSLGEDVVNLAVSDTGEGILESDLEHIFDRFYQGKAKSHENISSTGIGLGLSKEFIELHGGQITVESTSGKGSTFSFTIPLEPDHPEEMDIEEDSKKARIVVVDDNPDMLSFIRINLSDVYDILTASDGASALEIITENCPDLLVTDVMMPDMDGLEVCRRIKQNILTSHIPVILLTARDGEEEKEEGYRSGADGFLSKPFTIKLLKARIDSLIELRKKLSENYRLKLQLSPAPIEIKSENDKFLANVMEVIERNMDNPEFNVQSLSDELPYSYLQLYRKVKALTGETVNELIRRVRLARAAQFLEHSDLRISEIMYSVGFNSHSYFTKCFREEYGVSPKEFAQSRRGVKVED